MHWLWCLTAPSRCNPQCRTLALWRARFLNHRGLWRRSPNYANNRHCRPHDVQPGRDAEPQSRHILAPGHPFAPLKGTNASAPIFLLGTNGTYTCSVTGVTNGTYSTSVMGSASVMGAPYRHRRARFSTSTSPTTSNALTFVAGVPGLAVSGLQHEALDVQRLGARRGKRCVPQRHSHYDDLQRWGRHAGVQ